MMIIVILGLAVLSIGLCIGAIALRSRSVATLNFMMCSGAAVITQPWATLALQPPSNPDDRINWILAMIWAFIFSASAIGLVYCLVVTRQPKQPKERRRRRRSRSRRDTPVSDE